jgi:hypothetical protein
LSFSNSNSYIAVSCRPFGQTRSLTHLLEGKPLLQVGHVDGGMPSAIHISLSLHPRTRRPHYPLIDWEGSAPQAQYRTGGLEAACSYLRAKEETRLSRTVWTRTYVRPRPKQCLTPFYSSLEMRSANARGKSQLWFGRGIATTVSEEV